MGTFQMCISVLPSKVDRQRQDKALSCPEQSVVSLKTQHVARACLERLSMA